jgi:hypothetical protein
MLHVTLYCPLEQTQSNQVCNFQFILLFSLLSCDHPFLCPHKLGAYSVALVRPSVRPSVCPYVPKSCERNSS